MDVLSNSSVRRVGSGSAGAGAAAPTPTAGWEDGAAAHGGSWEEGTGRHGGVTLLPLRPSGKGHSWGWLHGVTEWVGRDL